MPELPDIIAYVEALNARVVGQTLLSVRIYGPSVLRSVHPPLEAIVGKKAVAVGHLGKRIYIEFESNLFLVFHLMIAARFGWKNEVTANRAGGKHGLAGFAFSSGSLTLVEAGSKKRASIMLVAGRKALEALDPGGLDVLQCTFDDFATTLRTENRSLKRALTNPTWFSGIGNAYSDEILHESRLSPLRLTSSLSQNEIRRLFDAAKTTLTFSIEKLRKDFTGRFPPSSEITAFREEFAVHGRYGKPCPDCGKPVQRIRYAENETNYCAQCQNEGRLLADRALSRLLKSDWPKTIEEMLGD